MKRHLFTKQDSNSSGFLAAFFLPFVFTLTKIGEYTVRFLTFLFRLVIGLSKSFKDVSWPSLHLPRLNRGLPKFPALRVKLPRLTLPRLNRGLPKRKKSLGRPALWRGKPRTKPIVLYPIPFRFKLRYFALGIAIAAIFFVPVIIRLWLSELPNPEQLAFREPALSTKLYDRNGKFLFQFYASQNRTKVFLNDIPQHLIDATIAIEDKNFYRHNGFDLSAIVRAARQTLINKNLQGGSTITQQLIKSTLLTPEVSLERKIKEVILAFLTEREFSKREILEMYFNQVAYGGTAWGIEAAAETYFGKSVADLKLAQSALLAGLPSAPTIYSPFGTQPQLAKIRQREVLDRMVAEGFISPKQADEAFAEPLAFAKPAIDIKAPHFVMYTKDFLVQKYGIATVEKGGLKVVTTLDLDIQQQAQDIVREEIEKLTSLSVTNGAALITNPRTGEILSMVGSRDYFDQEHDGNVNVTTALRQPGSSIKLVTYAAALEKGLTAATILDDSPITYSTAGSPSYSPVNYDGRFHGKVTLRTAFGNSYNVPAVKTLSQVGVSSMIDMGKKLGITTWNDTDRFGLSLTLGGGEVKMVDLATAYGTVAAGGLKHNLSPLLKVTNSYGEVLEDRQNSPSKGSRVLSEGIAFILADILADNNARLSAFGPNSVLNISGKKVSVKTGTSDNKRDNWTIGFSQDKLVAVWVGNNDNRPMNPSLTSGITGAAPIWNKITTSVLLQNAPASLAANIPTPADVVAIGVCSINGYLPCGGCPTRTEYFIQGTQPKLACKSEWLTPTPAIGGPEPSPEQ